MKRVAIVFEEDIFNQKGTFHAKLERVRHLAARPELEVEVFCVQVRWESAGWTVFPSADSAAQSVWTSTA